MVEGERFEAWNHTAQILVALCEPYRDAKKHPRPFAPAEFHPYGKDAGGRADYIPPMKGTFELMKKMWVDEKPKRGD